MPGPSESLLTMLLALAILAIVAGLPALLLYRRTRNESPLLPQAVSRPVPWNGWLVLIAFVAVLFFPILVQTVLEETDFFPMLYGPAFPRKIMHDTENQPFARQAAHLRGLWAQAIGTPILVILLITGLRYGTRATPSQIGLTREHAGRNIVLGYVGWLVMTPLVLGIFMLMLWLMVSNPDKHPLMDLGPLAGKREWLVFALQAAIFAPVVEELLFRGILLSWLQQAPDDKSEPEQFLPTRFRPHVVYAGAVFLSLQSPALIDAFNSGRGQQILTHLAPFFFLLAILPLYLVLPMCPHVCHRLGLVSPQMVRAWIGSSVLFAAIHSNVWPSPIPLFALGLGMGWLAIRTGSIIPSIVVHALFNAVAVVYLLLGGPS